jgi:hypothetical protein
MQKREQRQGPRVRKCPFDAIAAAAEAAEASSIIITATATAMLPRRVNSIGSFQPAKDAKDSSLPHLGYTV